MERTKLGESEKMTPSRPSQEPGEFEFVPKSREKAEEIASEKFFGHQLMSPETVQKIRDPLRTIFTEFGSSALSAIPETVKGILNLAQVPKNITDYIPGNESFKKGIEEISGEPLAEVGPIGEYFKDIASRVGQFMGLGAAPTAVATFGVPLAGATVKHTLKSAGAPEWLQTGATMLTDLYTGFHGAQSARAAARDYHREAARLIPQEARMDASAFEGELNRMIRDLKRGGADPVKAPVLTKAREIVNVIEENEGALPVNEAFAFRTSVNNVMGDPSTLEGSRRLFPLLNRRLNEFMDVYGRTQNPEFLAALNEGDDIVQALANAKRATKFLQDKGPKGLNSPLTWLAFALAPVKMTFYSTAGKLAQFGHEILNSPALRRYYFHTIRDALQGNSKQAIHNLKAFDKEAQKSFPELEEGDFEYIPQKKSKS